MHYTLFRRSIARACSKCSSTRKTKDLRLASRPSASVTLETRLAVATTSPNELGTRWRAGDDQPVPCGRGRGWLWAGRSPAEERLRAGSSSCLTFARATAHSFAPVSRRGVRRDGSSSPCPPLPLRHAAPPRSRRHVHRCGNRLPLTTILRKMKADARSGNWPAVLVVRAE